MGEPTKWTCHYCTYDNFAASKKCTLCRTSRPTQLITDTAHQEQDIYKMASLVSPVSDTGSGSPGSSICSVESKKWSCQSCTYLNWPKSLKCIQCLTPRKKSSSSNVVTSPSGQSRDVETHSVSVSISENTVSGRSTPKRTSPNSPDAAKALNNDINKMMASQSKCGSKWTCKACTYENWPKSLKCTICGTPRGQFLPGELIPESGLPITGHSSPISPLSPENSEVQAGASASSPVSENRNEEKRLRYLRKKLRDKDWLWLNACMGVVDGDATAVEAYIRSGGSPSRQLTQDEVILLNRPSALEVGYTLVHLAIRFQREDLLAVLLVATDPVTNAVKCLPSHTSPDLATDIRRQIASSIRQRKGDFPCYFLADCVTFALPADIEDLQRHVQSQLFDELLDKDVQNELEVEESIINWSVEITDRLSSRLYCLWNRTAGDCLLDSILQATWGIFDIDNTLRRALSDSLTEGAATFYPRWKEYESVQAQSMQFSLDESQWQRDWALLLSLAGQPGASLEQTHVFALAHILRRPIIVYGVKYVKSFKGETIGFAKFQGVYLPLLWERSFCWKTPITLGYTRGHFTALVAMESDNDDAIGAGANLDTNDDCQVAYLPLVDNEGKLLPIHFVSASEIGREESLLRDWMECLVTKGGLLVAVQRRGKRPPLVKQMMDEWLDHYRRLAQVVPAGHQDSLSGQPFSSDGESDQE